jgi:hypothetical protein
MLDEKFCDLHDRRRLARAYDVGIHDLVRRDVTQSRQILRPCHSSCEELQPKAASLRASIGSSDEIALTDRSHDAAVAINDRYPGRALLQTQPHDTLAGVSGVTLTTFLVLMSAARIRILLPNVGIKSHFDSLQLDLTQSPTVAGMPGLRGWAVALDIRIHQCDAGANGLVLHPIRRRV